MSRKVYIIDWFNASINPSFIHIPQTLPSDTREEIRAKYAMRQNIIALSVKKCIVTKQPNMLSLVEREIIELGFKITHKTKTQLRFTVPCIEVMGMTEWLKEVEEKLHKHFSHCRKTKWANMVVYDTDSLTSNIIMALKKNDYRVKAVAFYSEKHGAIAALDVLDMVDRVWSLRV